MFDTSVYFINVSVTFMFVFNENVDGPLNDQYSVMVYDILTLGSGKFFPRNDDNAYVCPMLPIFTASKSLSFILLVLPENVLESTVNDKFVDGVRASVGMIRAMFYMLYFRNFI